MQKAPSARLALLISDIVAAVDDQPVNKSNEFASIWQFPVDSGLIFVLEERDGGKRWEVTFKTEALALDLLWQTRVEQLITLVKKQHDKVLGRVKLFLNAFDGTETVVVYKADRVWQCLERAVDRNRAKTGGKFVRE